MNKASLKQTTASTFKEPVLEVKSLFASFNDLMVLDNINMQLNKGEFVSIIGPSGCGKTTLFNIIANLLPVTKGEVLIKGKSKQSKQVAYMYQKDLLLPWRKLIDNVGLPYELKGYTKNQIKTAVMPYFKLFNLQGFENYYPFQISGGMKQRAALMRTYLCEKEIMLLDEPFGGLDAITKLKMEQWLKTFSKEMNTTILFITHDIEEAIYLSDRIYILSNRPAKIIQEIKIDICKDDYASCITSKEFNGLKAQIMKLLTN